MPDERLITEIESLLAQVVALGGENERSQMVPNLTVQDANPTGLTGFVIVSDDRDGDNILAKKVPSVIYSNNDLVNVLFPKGGEAIAFQQGSQSTNSGIWEIVPSTSTDIFYDKGNVGIGDTPDAPFHLIVSDASSPVWAATDVAIFERNGSSRIQIHSNDTNEGSVWFTDTVRGRGQINYNHTGDNMEFFTAGARQMTIDSSGNVGIGNSSPSAKVEILDTAGPQLQLTFADGVKFTDFTVDTNHNLTITPTSTGQIILQPTTDSTDFFQVLDSDGGVPILNIDSAGEKVGIGTDTIPHGSIGLAKFAINGQNNSLSGPHIQITTDIDDFPIFQQFNWGHDNVGLGFDVYFDGQFRSADAGTNCIVRKLNDNFLIAFDSGIAQGSPVVFNTALNIDLITGDTGIGVAVPSEKLDVAGNIALDQDVIRRGDTDTKISLTTDDIEFTAGGLSMLKLTEAAQDLITLGPGSGDVDINFNGDMFLHGSNGRLGINTVLPSGLIDVRNGNVFIGNSTDTGTGSAEAHGALVLKTTAARTRTLAVWMSNLAGEGAHFVSNFGDTHIDVTSSAERIFIAETGSRTTVGSTASPVAQLHIDQPSTIAGIPVGLFDQADTDEPFIKFIGEAAAVSPLTRSIVDEGDVTTATRIGWVKIEIDDVGNQVTDGDYFVPFYSLA